MILNDEVGLWVERVKRLGSVAEASEFLIKENAHPQRTPLLSRPDGSAWGSVLPQKIVGAAQPSYTVHEWLVHAGL
jgi:hypothetical protein